MKPFATAALLALGCAGCTEHGASFAALYNYNAFTCVQLQTEAALVSLEAATALGGAPRRPEPVDPNAVLVVAWPDPAAAGTPQGRELKARMEALARASRGKSCAIRFQAAAAR